MTSWVIKFGGRGGGIHWFGMKCYIVPFTLLIDGLLNHRQPNSFYNCTIFISAAQTSLQAPQKLQYNGRKKGLVLTGDISLSEVANDGQHIHMNILSTAKPVLGIATACVIKIISIYSRGQTVVWNYLYDCIISCNIGSENLVPLSSSYKFEMRT